MPYDIHSLPPDDQEHLHRLWNELGAEGKPHNDCLPEDRPWRTCVHEAAHAVLCVLLRGDDALFLTFVCARGGGVLDLPTMCRADLLAEWPSARKMGLRSAARSAIVGMAGIAADARFYGVSLPTAAAMYEGNDLENVAALSREWRLRRGVSKAGARAYALVQIPSVWRSILLVAALLKVHGFVSADHICNICKANFDHEALIWKRRRFPKPRTNENA